VSAVAWEEKARTDRGPYLWHARVGPWRLTVYGTNGTYAADVRRGYVDDAVREHWERRDLPDSAAARLAAEEFVARAGELARLRALVGRLAARVREGVYPCAECCDCRHCGDVRAGLEAGRE
jgi:hypothetical protein